MMPTRSLLSFIACAIAGVVIGCGTTEKQKDAEFHTSGSREADQRAEETVAKTQQLRGEGMNQSETNRTLYARLGGEEGLKSIVSDWVDRAIADPRVNWKRMGVKSGGVLGIGDKDMSWQPDEYKLQQMKKHIVQYLSTTTGGPAHYDGRDMKTSHAGMKITNSEFDAAVGDLQATLEAHKVQTQEIKELLANIETTREQMVEER